jgi:hypothetical protein
VSQLAREIASLSDAERRARVEPLSAAERGELIAGLDTRVLLAIASARCSRSARTA